MRLQIVDCKPQLIYAAWHLQKLYIGASIKKEKEKKQTFELLSYIGACIKKEKEKQQTFELLSWIDMYGWVEG